MLPQGCTINGNQNGSPLNVTDVKMTSLNKSTNAKCQSSKPMYPLGDLHQATQLIFAELIDIEEDDQDRPILLLTPQLLYQTKNTHMSLLFSFIVQNQSHHSLKCHSGTHS